MGRVPVGSWTHGARREQGIRPSGEGKGKKKNKKRGHTFPQLHSQALQTSWGRSCGPAAPTRHSRGAPLRRSVRPSVHPAVSTVAGRFHLPFTKGQDFSCEHGQGKAALPLVYHKFGQATGKIFRSLGGTQSGWKQYWPLRARSPSTFFVKSKKNGCLLTGKLRTEKVINSIVCRK